MKNIFGCVRRGRGVSLKNKKVCIFFPERFRDYFLNVAIFRNFFSQLDKKLEREKFEWGSDKIFPYISTRKSSLE